MPVMLEGCILHLIWGVECQNEMSSATSLHITNHAGLDCIPRNYTRRFFDRRLISLVGNNTASAPTGLRRGHAHAAVLCATPTPETLRSVHWPSDESLPAPHRSTMLPTAGLHGCACCHSSLTLALLTWQHSRACQQLCRSSTSRLHD